MMNFRQKVIYKREEWSYIIRHRMDAFGNVFKQVDFKSYKEEYKLTRVFVNSISIFLIGLLISIIQPKIPPLPNTIWHPAWISYGELFRLPLAFFIFLGIWLILFILAQIKFSDIKDLIDVIIRAIGSVFRNPFH